jgi:trans-aconitate methyltransferase
MDRNGGEWADSNGAEFDEYAEDYDDALQQGLKYSGEDAAYFAAARVQWLGRRLGELGFAPHSLLDFGCGTGASTPLFFTMLNVAEVRGIDASRRLLETARRKYGGVNATFAAPAGYVPSGEMDIAFCNGVFHHIPPSKRRGALEYIWSSLRPGGIFAFWENNPWNPGTRFVMSRIPFDRGAMTIPPSEARELLQGAGYEVLRTDHLFFFPRMLRWLRPVEKRLASIPLGAQYLVLARKLTRS